MAVLHIDRPPKLAPMRGQGRFGGLWVSRWGQHQGGGVSSRGIRRWPGTQNFHTLVGASRFRHQCCYAYPNRPLFISSIHFRVPPLGPRKFYNTPPQVRGGLFYFFGPFAGSRSPGTPFALLVDWARNPGSGSGRAYASVQVYG